MGQQHERGVAAEGNMHLQHQSWYAGVVSEVWKRLGIWKRAQSKSLSVSSLSSNHLGKARVGGTGRGEVGRASRQSHRRKYRSAASRVLPLLLRSLCLHLPTFPATRAWLQS